MAFFKTYLPAQSLPDIVREFQVYHIKWDEEKNPPAPFITCLANTEQNLYFYINNPVRIIPAENVEIPCPAAVVTGPKFKPVGLLFGKDHLMIKVAFHPTGSYRLLGIDMQQTVNAGLDATTIWGNDINRVMKELKEAADYDAMINIVSSFIEQKFDASCRPGEAIDQVAMKMLDPLQDISLKEWASMACLSLRQFERNFITRVGISPKLYIRIVRFEYAMKIKNNHPQKTWAEIALECGYTDSSHFLREFKAFADFPPSRLYLKQTSGYSDFPTG